MLGKSEIPPNIAFGKVLKELRLLHGFSQEKLAFEANIQRNYVSLIERGVNQPTVTTIFKLAIALDVQPSTMIAMVETRINETECSP